MWSSLLALEKHSARIDFLMRYRDHNMLSTSDPIMCFSYGYSLGVIFFFLQLAEELFREHIRKLVEESISSALAILKSRTRTVYELFIVCSLPNF